MNVDGVLFDVDDTLVDTRGAFSVALGAVAETYLPHLGTEARTAVLSHWRADPSGYYRRFTSGEIDYRAQRKARANELFALFGGPVLDDAAYDVWSDVFEEGFQGAWCALPDALATIALVREAGFRTGALSNAAVAYQSLKLARTGLLDDVPMLVGVDTLGVGKPDPRVFLEACRLLGTEPSRTVYVGDELDIDARAAREAGLIGVWLDLPGARRIAVADAEIDAALAVGVLRVDALSAIPLLLADLAEASPAAS